jgi:ABC-type bacteriocin/lantibiotic exporter with double-glycine peptidase domain
MDLTTLRSIKQPVVLHTVNQVNGNHFLVCFGAGKKYNTWQYLIGDPARHMVMVPEHELVAAWQSKAALYFEDISFSKPEVRRQACLPLFSVSSFPAGLWLAIPFLNICATFLGIALSVALQRGIEDSLAGKKRSLIVAVLFLLLIITIFKSIVTYIRQRVLIKLNNAVNEQFINSFIQKIISRQDLNFMQINEGNLRVRLADIQKIQNAVSNFAAVMLSEGLLIMLVLSGLFFVQPIVGLVNLAYLVLVFWFAVSNMPYLSYQTAYLNELSAITEFSLLKEVQTPAGPGKSESRFKIHRENHGKYLSQAKFIATRISRFNLLYECIGTVSVLAVFILCLAEIQKMAMSNGTLMVIVITSYYIAVLMPRVCNAFTIIYDGVEAARQFNMGASSGQL